MTAEPVAPRALYVHGRKGNAWLDDEVMVLQQDGLRRRIPLAAVAEVRNGGRRQASLEITLRTEEGVGTGPVRYELEARSGATVDLFVEAVTAALPAAHAAQPVGIGAELVVEEPDPQAVQRTEAQRRKSRRFMTGFVVCVVLWVAGLVTVAVEGRPTGNGSDPVDYWVIGTMALLIGGGLTTWVVFIVRGWVVRRRRGVGVVAVFERNGHRHKVFVFTDAAGERHEYIASRTIRTIAEDPPRIQLIHDPLGKVGAEPHESLAYIIARCTCYLVIGLPFLAGGLYAVPYQLVRALFPVE
ncbi:hypothetical protein ACFWPV_38615 [Streptomyces uncialis]|uniref:hypothetical protein n=1 Tax=Streptomyces uncialis TaxID=1048205 RepID=UPI00364658D1